MREQQMNEITQYISGICKRCERKGLINEHGFCTDCAIRIWRRK